MPWYSPSSISGTTSNSALKRSGSPSWKWTSLISGVPDHVQVLRLELLLEELGDQAFQHLSAGYRRRTACESIEAGALPGRKPGSLARFCTSAVTRPVSLSTSWTGMEISSECLQPSTKAKWI